MHVPREPKPLAGAVYHPGAGFHSYPPPKDRRPRRRVCPHCELPAETAAANCPVCGARYEPTLPERLKRRLART
jgi:uncharacterized paraquat-inducible protein A